MSPMQTNMYVKDFDMPTMHWLFILAILLYKLMAYQAHNADEQLKRGHFCHFRRPPSTMSTGERVGKLVM